MRRYTLQLLLLTTVLLTVACEDKKTSKENKVTIIDTSVSVSSVDTVKKATYSNTVKVNYEQNKEILDIIPLIPDSAMQSWEWSKAERKSFLGSIKANNYFIDTTENYNTIIKVTPQYFATQVVDGVFTATTYKLNNGSLLIITCDIVGDGKHFCAYRLQQEVLMPVTMTEILGTVENSILLNLNDTKCAEKVEEAKAFSDYDFTHPNAIEVSLPLTKAQAKDCIKGNTFKLTFNAATGKFDLQSVTWY